MEQFYLTLPSNSSMDYYPGNTVANYSTHLARRIELNGQWEVALVELHYPCSFQSLDESSITIKAYREQPANLEALQLALSTNDGPTLSGESRKKNTPQIVEAYTVIEKVPRGNYQDVQDIIDLINKHPVLASHILFKYNTETNKVEVAPKSHVVKVEIPAQLAMILGLDPAQTDFKINNKAIRPANLYLGLPSYMYIYCDIVEPQHIGDTMASLLRIVNIDISEYVYGAHKHVQFHSPHYVPVMKGSFESLEIDIRDSLGEKIAFQFGTSCIKLHFRKVLQ